MRRNWIISLRYQNTREKNKKKDKNKKRKKKKTMEETMK